MSPNLFPKIKVVVHVCLTRAQAIRIWLKIPSQGEMERAERKVRKRKAAPEGEEFKVIEEGVTDLMDGRLEEALKAREGFGKRRKNGWFKGKKSL